MKRVCAAVLIHAADIDSSTLTKSTSTTLSVSHSVCVAYAKTLQRTGQIRELLDLLSYLPVMGMFVLIGGTVKHGWF